MARIAPPSDYLSQLRLDPQLDAALRSIQGLQTQDQAGLRGQVQQAVEQYGGAPAGLTGSLAGFVDPTTQALAQQGTDAGVTTLAQLQHAYDIARQGSLASLAARGMLHSGALGQHGNEDARVNDVAHFHALQQLLGNLQGYQNTYLGEQAGLTQQREQATNDALTRQIQLIQAGVNPGAPVVNGHPVAAASTPPDGSYHAPSAASGGLATVAHAPIAAPLASAIGLGQVPQAPSAPKVVAGGSLASAGPAAPRPAPNNLAATQAAVGRGATVVGF